MAQEEIKYTIPSDGSGANDGRQVDLIVTYDPTTPNTDGSFTVTAADGTYTTLSDGGQVISSDAITGLDAPGVFFNDNKLYIQPDPSTASIVTAPGISFKISNNADSNDGNGNVNFEDVNAPLDGSTPTGTPDYQEGGPNHSQATSVTEAPVCFVSGTSITTLRGITPVEQLTIGDLIPTASGLHRPIRWLGHRTIDCRSHTRLQDVMPVRISANAFGENRPVRDLFVSPSHSICIDILGEVLIPAIALVNGSTIQQVDVDEVTYWHVELDSHDVIFAEDLPAESYLDMGNRGFFNETDVVDLNVGPDVDPASLTHADFCRPFHSGGPLVDVVKSQLAKRAAAQGWILTHDLDMHLDVDGQRIDPVVRGLVARFPVPAGAKDVWLVSPTARPCDILGLGDRRDLGLCIGALRIDDGFDARDIAIDHPLLCVGFHGVEEGVRRWTGGRARLPAALWEGCEDCFYLRVDLAGMPVPRWTAPAEQVAAANRSRLAIVA